MSGPSHREKCCASSSGDGHPYDLIVLGGGSAGFAAAIQAHELGKTALMVNAGTIGGTCVNVGCVPSKTLIRAAEALHRGGHHAFAGIRGEAAPVDFEAVIRQKDELVSQLRKAKYVDVLDAYDRVSLVEGRARLESPRAVRVNGVAYEGSRLLIATGSRPRMPDIPGLAGSDPLDSTSAFALTRFPESMIVLGGRYIALEIAQMFARFGTKVTVLQRSRRILPTEDTDLTAALTGYLREEGLCIETGVRLRDVRRGKDGVVIRALVGDAEREFSAERILCATGRRANIEDLGLEEKGVRLSDQGEIWVDEHLQTSQPGIFAAGDVIGEPAFVYTAAYEGRLAAANALGSESKKRDYRALPWVIFCDPQVAGVGLNEQEAARSGIEVDVATLDLKNVPRALAARDTRGFIKLIRRKGSDELIGARILAQEGGEQIMEAALAIRHGIGVSDLASAFHPYLTQAEGIKLCAQTFGKDVAKLSCCSA
ncbi:MAG: mercury(II) reductase [Verrucomicrobia bacterium]|nr:MAG: mercury(II) reductase [Verrucomicrobiota bacterium]